jgi:transcriptional regulator with XRE-family HTH domain
MSQAKSVVSPSSAGESTSPAVLCGVAFCLGIGWFSACGAAEPTSATVASPFRAARAAQSAGLLTCTDAGQSAEPDPEHLAGITELRQLTGFTWDRLGELFGVSRRAVHHWASGKPMAEDNEEHLQRCLHVLRVTDRGDAMANRQALLSVGDGGKSAFDLLVLQRYAEATQLLGRAVNSIPSRRARTTVPPERLPLHPQVLADARDDVEVRDRGPRRTVRVVRRGRGA